ncbi:hypothetical protein CLSAB_19170 [Clostridium saccharobutylicum]|uniref:hypothetical protein n=1 Tax=Clostridium saccharobutylicum TaxID=169679 RepID=UPI0009D54343|nr:hypothetical protein [Clostridium saccharobutylicum]OOM17197.1 hypothetical protein CLSAB_19170 [Clostridium saccharobutylicum]
MITKQITVLELHFDNSQECEDYQKIYEKKGYKITLTGSEDDWYFRCGKIEE